MPLYIDIGTQTKTIGKAKVVNKGLRRTGRTLYEVQYDMTDGVVLTLKLYHRREDGALRLVELVAKKLRRAVREYYSYPPEIVVMEGKTECIMCKDIPERFRKPMAKDMPVGTGAVIDGQTAMFRSDLDDWIAMKVNGVRIPFD